jgi:hypothetical protein
MKKVYITVDERVCAALRSVVGRRRIGQFIESLVRTQVVGNYLEIAHRQRARAEAREAEALEWSEAAPKKRRR